MDESIYVSSMIDKLPSSWKDFKHSLKHGKDNLSLVQLGSHLCIEESLRAQESDKGKGKEVDNNGGSGSGSNKKPKLECWKCGKIGHFKRDCHGENKKNSASASGSGKGSEDQSQDQNRCRFNTYELVEDGSVLYMGDDHFAPVHGNGSVVLEFSSGKSITLFNVLYVPKLHKNLICGPVLNKCGYKQVYESDKYILSTSSVFLGYGYYNNGMFMLNLNKVPDDSGSVYMSSSIVVNTSLWHASERKNRALKEMVDSMLSYSGLSDGFCGEAMAVVRLPDPKRKTLGEKGIDCIFVGYAEHSKAYRFYVIEPNDYVSINTIIGSRDAIFDENRFSSIPRPKDIIPNSDESQRDDHSNDVPSETPEPHKGKRVRKAKSYGSDFQLYLVEGSGDQIGSQYSYCYSIEEDPRIYNEAMTSRDVAFWKKAIDDLIGIDYFDTYAPVARITTIRLLSALAAIQYLVLHQIDVKTAFLNGDLEEEMYMKQLEGFVMTGNEHKVCKLVNSLYGLKQSPKQWHQKFDEVVLSSGFLLNQSDKCVYSKFNGSGKGVIICLYVDDMLIFGTDQNQVDKTKKFLSSKFSMKDMREADVILGIKIKCKNKGIVIKQSHYIEKILKKFNREDCSSVSTPMDLTEKLMVNLGKLVDQLEYSRVIGCLMYAMTSTRPDIAYAGIMNYGLSYAGYPSMLEGYSDASWINHVEDSSSTSGWVFLLGGGAISWASKKQTCITSSTMESEFVALAAAGNKAESLRNLIHKISIWLKPIALISIHCDSATTLAKAYSQIYNGKSRHLGVRHIMIWELTINGMISIEFVQS
ncbi:zinc finger, CCHC-type containing protein [Tanacetum coccineum]